jgi:DNA invertase Pin-like site-specific DNA recombinase
MSDCLELLTDTARSHLENRRRLCRDHARSEGTEIIAEFADLAVSGQEEDPKRPGFESALGLLPGREVETLFVAKLDRFSRRGAQPVLQSFAVVGEWGGVMLPA